MRQDVFYYLITLAFCLSGMQGCAGQKMPSPSSGEIYRHADFPSRYVSNRNVDVWVPEGYPDDESYAVLYMHDGQNLFDSAVTWNKQEWMVDETASRLTKNGQVKRMIIVGIFNNGEMRHPEYFPEKPFRNLEESELASLESNMGKEDLDQFRNTLCSDQYLRFIVEELKPFIDSTYNTKSDRSNTCIAGSSMGGLISMYTLCEYPDVFSAAGCLSTHWPGFGDYPENPVPDAFVQYLDKHLPPPLDHRIWFDHGTEKLDASYAPYQVKVDEVMHKHGYSTKNWITKTYPGEDHSERAWQKRFDEVLLFLAGR